MRKKGIKGTLKQVILGRTLANKIRYSYILLTLPFMLLIIYCVRNIWEINQRYDDMVNSTLLATEFGLDFKQDFDYETYLLIAGNTPLDKSDLKERLSDARIRVNRIKDVTILEENRQKLVYVQKFLDNLENYTARIEENLRVGNKYEECIEIWENDVQVVTTLIRDTLSEFIYCEVRELQAQKVQYETIYHDMIFTSFVFFGFAVVVILVMSYMIPRTITRPITEITSVTDEVAKGNLSVHAREYDGTEAMVLADSINVMIDKINELLVQVKEEQLQLRKAEFELLQAQINPHFLYNTLDAIVWLAESGDEKKVVSMVENLSSFFRTSLNQGREIVTLRDEIEHVRSYLGIQKVRYSDILQYEIDVADNTLECRIPKLSLQPFVENAIYHGIKEKRGGGQINISARKVEDKVLVEISDTGAGMEKDRLLDIRGQLDSDKVNMEERSIYGMYNVNQRMKLHYGKDYSLEIDSTPGEGTCVRVFIPLQGKVNVG